MATRLLVPAVLLLLVWTLAGTEDALSRLGNVDWRWIVLALLLANVQIVLSALRWWLVARRLGLDLPFREAVAEYYLAQLINQTVPGGVVGDAARAVRSRHRADLARAAQAVVIERMLGQVMLWAVLAVGLVVSFALPGGIVWPALSPPATVALLIAVTVLAGLVVMIGRGRLRTLKSMREAIAMSVLHPRARSTQLALGLIIVATNLILFAIVARALGIVMPIEAIVTLVPIILASMLIPATIAGWGFREGAAAALFPLMSATSAEGLATSLVFGLVVLASSLPGAVVLLLQRQASVKPSLLPPQQ